MGVPHKTDLPKYSRGRGGVSNAAKLAVGKGGMCWGNRTHARKSEIRVAGDKTQVKGEACVKEDS